jgi:hypothetical protein
MHAIIIWPAGTACVLRCTRSFGWQESAPMEQGPGSAPAVGPRTAGHASCLPAPARRRLAPGRRGRPTMPVLPGAAVAGGGGRHGAAGGEPGGGGRLAGQSLRAKWGGCQQRTAGAVARVQRHDRTQDVANVPGPPTVLAARWLRWLVGCTARGGCGLPGGRGRQGEVLEHRGPYRQGLCQAPCAVQSPQRGDVPPWCLRRLWWPPGPVPG